jgi:hypothetical protein
MVPPKKTEEGIQSTKVQEIAGRQIKRLQNLPIDGLILYDIQDEATRTAEARPFPFMETYDGFAYNQEYLQQLDIPKVIYRSVGKYTPQELTTFVQASQKNQDLSVFVGASSGDQNVTLSMAEAYKVKQQAAPELLLGGVTISERHTAKGNEHLRVFQKMKRGCSFFVSQGVYDVNASKNFLSDYYYHGKEQGIPLAPIIFTLTPCGSTKTLEFMKWLGIQIPRWLENELVQSQDILEKSVYFAEQNWKELKAFAQEKDIPIGCNIESVAIRKVEVEASIELLHRVCGK